jgi:isochorismate synthase
MTATELDKIVVSRFVETELPAGFAPVDTFLRLCARYAHAFVSLVAIPGIGTWIGASPELLLAVEPAALQTMALAGTQAKPANLPLHEIQWSRKEIEEQALVSEYVRRFFAGAGAVGVQEEGPHTVAAGNVVHRQTLFRVPFGQTDAEQQRLLTLANGVLHQLHPTSAVCGMPKDKALSFILAHEGYNRRFYSGFLGPVHIDHSSHLFVNLRCMQLGERTARVYVGCGITADSVPEAEWQESVLKSQTLLSVLHSRGAAYGSSNGRISHG